MDQVTVIGGGLAGLIAATEVAEAGVPVRLLEGRKRLGGRAQSLEGPYKANLGPHALYTGTTLWDWLRERGLQYPFHTPSLRAAAKVRFRWRGELRRTPPGLLRGLRQFRRDVPVDRDLRSWVTEHAGPDVAQLAAGAAGPLVFDYDPGRLSARSVVDKHEAILLKPRPPARYLVGGWSALVDRIAAHARAAGVVVENGVRVGALDEVTATGPVIVAVDPGSARTLLADETLRPESPRVALLDLGLTSRRGDPYVVFDLDEAAFVDRFTAVVPTLAPTGHELVQASVGLRPDEGLDAGIARLEAIVDLAFPHWRDRLTWHRRGLVTESTGAVDLPGTTWRDRPPVAYAEGVWLAGDWVAAPGHLAEVSCNSAVAAAHAVVSAGAARGWSARLRVRRRHEQEAALGPLHP